MGLSNLSSLREIAFPKIEHNIVCINATQTNFLDRHAHIRSEKQRSSVSLQKTLNKLSFNVVKIPLRAAFNNPSVERDPLAPSFGIESERSAIIGLQIGQGSKGYAHFDLMELPKISCAV